MAHSLSLRRIVEAEQAQLEYFRVTERPWTDRVDRESKLAVAVFNVRVRSRYPQVLAWPTFRACLNAERFFLTVWCPGCGQTGCIDIRPKKLLYHPDASVNSLTDYFACTRCQPKPPRPQITGLWRRPR